MTAIKVTPSQTNCCRGTVQPRKWQLTGIDCSTAAQASGSTEPALKDYWAHCITVCSQQVYYVPINHARPSCRNPCTSIYGSLLIYWPLRDVWLSWPCWLTDSGLLNQKLATHLAQDRESSPAETRVLTTMLRRQLNDIAPRWLIILLLLRSRTLSSCKVVQQQIWGEVASLIRASLEAHSWIQQ